MQKKRLPTIFHLNFSLYSASLTTWNALTGSSVHSFPQTLAFTFTSIYSAVHSFLFIFFIAKSLAMTTADVSSSINKPSPDHTGAIHRKRPALPPPSMLDPSSDSVHVRKRDHVNNMTDDDRQEMGDYTSSNGESKLSENREPQTLAPSDVPNFILLVVLYLLQGIPVGLSFGSIPFLLKAKMSYSEIAIFSLSSWPYSLKLLWSPIVDAIYWPELGRRKSWIIPIQTLTGLLFLALGWHIDAIMAEVKFASTKLSSIIHARSYMTYISLPFLQDTINIYFITTLFLVTIFFCATQGKQKFGFYILG